LGNNPKRPIFWAANIVGYNPALICEPASTATHKRFPSKLLILTRGTMIKSGAELRKIVNFCAAEPALVEWLLQMNSDYILLDVGANIGQYTIFAVVASGISALGRSSRMATLSFRHRTPVASAQDIVHPSQALPRGKSFEQFELVSIDDLRDNAGMPVPTCVKIDVDGHEEDVVAGMRQLLDKSPPRSLMIETRKWNTKNWSFVDELRERGYAVRTSDSPKNLYRTRNI
jgi:hypothetical protein